MKRLRAAIYGGSGFAGAELIRRLLIHPEVELVRVCSIDHVGEPLAAAHPHLEGATDLVFEPFEPKEAASDVDIVLLGLPHTVSIEVVTALLKSTVKILDMSGAFRLTDAAAYARHYGGAHPRPDLLGEFVYGLPELHREKIRGARFVASPGCFATTVELALLPLAERGLLEGPVDVVGITGSSGSGVTPSAATHHPVRAQNLRTYRPLLHQHVPEMEATLRAAGAPGITVNFVPISAPLTRGIFVTAFARVPAKLDDTAVREVVTSRWRGEPFVRVPKKRLPEVVAVTGSNHAEVGVVAGAVEGDTRLVTCFGATDNLIKGGAGQGIQNMNLMLGLDERLSLLDVGGYP